MPAHVGANARFVMGLAAGTVLSSLVFSGGGVVRPRPLLFADVPASHAAGSRQPVATSSTDTASTSSKLPSAHNRAAACREALRQCLPQKSSGMRMSKRHFQQMVKAGGKPKSVLDCEKGRGGSAYSLMQPCYPNEAMEREFSRVDRWIVDSMAFVYSFDGNSIDHGFTGFTGQQPKPIKIIVLTVNRQIPYLAVLVTTLLRGHDIVKLLRSVDLHFINIEKRPCKCQYALFEELDARIPFATFHYWTENDQIGHDSTQNNDTTAYDKAMYNKQYKMDYVRAMKLCKGNGTDWCFILEEDVALSAQLIPKFLQVTDQLKGEFDRSNLGVLSLYYPENEWLNDNGKNLIHGGGDQYERDKTAADFKINIPREGGPKGISMSDNFGVMQIKSAPTRRIKYRLEKNDRGYGAVALAYPNERLDEIIEYVTDTATGDGKGVPLPLDVTIMTHFHQIRNYTKLMVSPSLIQHIGFYSEHRSKQGRHDRDPSWRLFEIMSTDARFHLSEGSDSSL